MVKFHYNGMKFTVRGKTQEQLQMEVKRCLSGADHIGGIVIDTNESGPTYFLLNQASSVVIYTQA